MRWCRFHDGTGPALGWYDEEFVIPLLPAAKVYQEQTKERLVLPETADLLEVLPAGSAAAAAGRLAGWLASQGAALPANLRLPTRSVRLLVPIPRPNKLLLLAGNYAKHIEEGGGKAAERAETFPYVFLKPPTTTLKDPGVPLTIPSVSPGAIDWELELGVIIGRTCRRVREAQALEHVAGYTVVNDISDRKFRPNPQRKPRERDAFFDWLHGKWHDGFCPMGPCVTSRDAIPDPQQLGMQLTLNGGVRQKASTGQMIFPVAAIIEFISSFVTLEPGDIISTGTPDGVGSASGTFLKPGDTLVASIDQIGSLVTPVAKQD